MLSTKKHETDEDILRQAAEFEANRKKNPHHAPVTKLINADNPSLSLFTQNRDQAQPSNSNVGASGAKKASGKSLFAQRRELAKAASAENKKSPVAITTDFREKTDADDSDSIRITKTMLDEIHENMLGDVRGTKADKSLMNFVMCELVENREAKKRPAENYATEYQASSNKKSIFAQRFMKNMASKAHEIPSETKEVTMSAGTARHSAIVQDPKLSTEIHAENTSILNSMNPADILAEKHKLLSSLDPALISMLTKKRLNQTKSAENTAPKITKIEPPQLQTESKLPETGPAAELLQQSDEGQWLNFNLVEDHKLAWMRDIPAKLAELKPGQQFNARFDWKGVLLPHTLLEVPQAADDRELYLHGEEPDRPGYSLQELFRLARSTVLQQRISAFASIAGMLSIYSQGFYDQVLTLPISKIFFLLRFGLDDNTPAQLEVVSKALSRLFYNETDEVLLDHIYENAYCHWQPTLPVLLDNEDSGDPTSLAFLQRHMALLRTKTTAINTDVDEEQDEGKERMSMDDFQLAETDLISCLLRTNILQRIGFILRSVHPENSCVESCLKLLIRIARTDVTTAKQLSQDKQLLNIILTAFLPSLLESSLSSAQTTFYGKPQYLCLKLLRVLICQHMDIAKQLANESLIERLKEYLFYREDIKGKMIRVQIEALRIVRCLLVLGILDRELFRQFLPALRLMLDWHYNHCVFDVGGPALIRQHAAALLVTIVASGESGACDIEAQQLLLDALHNCCCSWMHKATHANGLKDYTQMTLLSAVVYAVGWFARHGYRGATSFSTFLRNILPDFVASSGFIACVQQLTRSSIIGRTIGDRRNIHAPLPNVGAVLMHDYGPQLIVSDTYPVQLLSNVWTLLQTPLEEDALQKPLRDALLQPAVLESLGEYLKELSLKLNRFLASNFFARSELKLVHQLLTTDGIETYLTSTQLLQLVYNYLCCLPTAQTMQMKSIFERYIFSDKYLQLDAKSLELLQTSCMEILYSHFIEENREPNLSLCYTQVPLLPPDWPYFQLRLILNQYLSNVKQQQVGIYSEHQVVRMTLTFVQQLEEQGLQIVTPLEKLMYLMISFMGPDNQFLDPELHKLLHAQLMQFYAHQATHHFDFEATFADKANFEPLYYLFVDHFEAASYGNELFSSLVLLPLAQKYDNKWRRRIWSEHVQALRFVNCDESLLIGGLAAYLEPVEQEPSLVALYAQAMRRGLLQPGSVAYKIASHHLSNYREKEQKV